MNGPAVRGSLPTAPRLDTARLRLRAHRVDDLPALAAIWAVPAVYRHIGGEPATRQDAWMRLLRYAGMWPLLGYGFWAIEDRATGALVGDIGYADFQRELSPPLDGMPELGWVLAPAFHGRGYASEALQAITAWGDACFGARREVCVITPDNTASIRVAEKGGFHPWYEATLGDTPLRVYARDRDGTAAS